MSLVRKLGLAIAVAMVALALAVVFLSPDRENSEQFDKSDSVPGFGPDYAPFDEDVPLNPLFMDPLKPGGFYEENHFHGQPHLHPQFDFRREQDPSP